ncbi:DUF2188 domain-containing protein [Actinomycetospora chlora]
MPDRHVQPSDGEWTVTVPGDEQVTARTATEVEAVERAVTIVSDHGGGEVVVHGEDGEVVDRRHVDAGDGLAPSTRAAAREAGAAVEAVGEDAAETAEDVARDASTTAKKAAGHTRTGARKAGATAAAAGSGIADQVRAVGEGDKDVSSAAQDAASIAQTTGEQIAERAEGTAREVAAEARAAGPRAAERVDEGARRAAEDAVAGADRTATLGARVGREAEDASDSVGRQIHAYTEALAAPLDQLARTLNPVRVTGRVVGVVVAGGLHLFGVGARSGTAAAQQGARRVAAR